MMRINTQDRSGAAAAKLLPTIQTYEENYIIPIQTRERKGRSRRQINTGAVPSGECRRDI
jgi:hypothetical protein